MSAEIVQMPSKDLAKHEKVIADGLRTFVDVGRSLAAIQESKLYKSAGFETFEAYCNGKWGMGRANAYELIGASAAHENVRSSRHSLPPPTSVAQCRPLAKLKEPKQQAKAWAKAVKTAPNGTPTAKHVASVVTEMLPKPAAKSKPRVHECPRHGCKFDDGQECPVCKDRREKGLDGKPAAEPADPEKWECSDCGTLWDKDVSECAHCTEDDSDEGDNDTEFNAAVKSSDLYDFTVGLLAEWPDDESYQPLLDVLGQLQKKIEKLENARCK